MNSTTAGTKVAVIQGPNFKTAKDEYVGKTVRITKGPWKVYICTYEFVYMFVYLFLCMY